MNNQEMQFDIIVCGGGISGSMAAISAAREGCSVLLVDQWGYLGGMLTGGGVGPMMTFHAGNKQVVRGITGELIERLAVRGKSPGHIFDTTGCTYTVTPFDAEAMKYELENMFLEAGGTILYHAMLQNTEVEGDKLSSVSFTVKGGSVTVKAKIFIDATGDADLSYLSGVPCTKGNKNGFCQPLTMNMKVYNVNIQRVKEFIKLCPQQFSSAEKDPYVVDKAERLSMGGFKRLFEEARKNGEIDFQREDVLFFETNNQGEVIINTSRMKEYDPVDPWQISKAETEGRHQALQIEKFLIRHAPGFEKAIFVHSCPAQVGVRSSRQIKGVYTLTYADLIAGKKFEDNIAHGGYPIDVHPPKGGHSEEFLKLSKEKKHLSWGHIYNIPYRSLINHTVKNLITVGRCISADYIAQGAIRVSPIAGAIGHAGGAAAAEAIKHNVDAVNVDFKAVQYLLKKQRAYIED